MTRSPEEVATREAEEKLGAARTLATDMREYFSHAIYAMKFVPVVHGLKRMACDEWYRVYYNPAWVVSQDVAVPDLVVGLFHEMTHLLRGHAEQGRNHGVTRDTAEVANVAMDAEANDDIRDDYKAERKQKKDMVMPSLLSRIIYAESFGCEDYALWTLYYEHLLKNATKITLLGDAPGASQGDTGSEGDGVVLDPCGSGATGVPQPWELGSPETSGVEGLDEGDRYDVQRLVAEAIQNHVRSRGSVPGGWSEWADEVLRPTPIPWDQRLDAAVHAGCDTTWGYVRPTYTRLGRRNPNPDEFAMPAWRRPRPFIAFVGDTSGSMYRKQLLLVRGVVQDIAQSLSARIAFIATDAEAHGDVQYVDEFGDTPLEMRGRGGTDMREGIAWALAHIVPAPTVIVVGTDGETPWPMRDVGVPVIACIVNNPGVKDPPSWITRIDVKEET